ARPLGTFDLLFGPRNHLEQRIGPLEQLGAPLVARLGQRAQRLAAGTQRDVGQRKGHARLGLAAGATEPHAERTASGRADLSERAGDLAPDVARLLEEQAHGRLDRRLGTARPERQGAALADEGLLALEAEQEEWLRGGAEPRDGDDDLHGVVA